ncbi:MAG: hypothetical protein PHG97_01940 [Candidatus Margulisbacteria bacterium]|nr:hypothetical protein [Candidatus Margulisiibacteriota bacterium]
MSLGIRIKHMMEQGATRVRAIERRGTAPASYRAEVTDIVVKTGAVLAKFIDHVAGYSSSDLFALSRPIPPDLRIGDIINVEIKRTRGLEGQVFLCRGKIESTSPKLPEQTKPEPTATEMKFNSPDELLSAGKNLYKKGPARGSLPAVQKEAEKWLALAKAEVENYKAKIGQDWTPELIAQRDTFCKLAKIINNFQLAIGPAPIEEVVIPAYQTGYRGGIYDHRPQSATSTPAAPIRPAEQHRPSPAPGSRFKPGDLIDVTIDNVNSMGAFTPVKGVTGWIKEPYGLSKGQTIKAKVIGEEHQEASGQHYLILEHHDPDALPRPREGRFDDFRTNAAGIIGKYVFIRTVGETMKTGFIPDYLAHSSSLRYSEFVDTGAVLVHHDRSFKVYCTKEFLDTIAPLLLKAIADGQIFIFDDAHFLSPEEELVSAQQFIFGLYQPRGVMRSETFKSLREQYYDEAYGHFPFRLTIEDFSDKWSVKDLIRAMAERPLQAVVVEKEAKATAASQPAKPPRPSICQTDIDLMSVIGKIRSINWQLEQGIIYRNEATKLIAKFNNSSVISWLDYLDSDPNNLVEEYNHEIAGWRSNLRDAIKILAFFRDYANQPERK